jgi:hypothetical protein
MYYTSGAIARLQWLQRLLTSKVATAISRGLAAIGVVARCNSVDGGAELLVRCRIDLSEYRNDLCDPAVRPDHDDGAAADQAGIPWAATERGVGRAARIAAEQEREMALGRP